MERVLRSPLALLTLLAFATPAFAQEFQPIRVNAGGGEYADAAGNVWQADTGFDPNSAAASVGMSEGASTINLFRVLLHSPPAAAMINGLKDTALRHFGLDTRLRELAIMRTAWLMGAEYVWNHHTRPYVEHDLDLNPADVLEVRDWRSSKAFGPTEHAVLGAPRQRFEHGGRRAEIAVGDPERDHVAARVAFPARAPGAGALDRGIEIEKGGQINISLPDTLSNRAGRKCRSDPLFRYFFGLTSGSFSRLSLCGSSCSSSCSCSPFSGSSSRRFALSSTSSVRTPRASSCRLCGNQIAIAGKAITSAIATTCSIMNSNIPL